MRCYVCGAGVAMVFALALDGRYCSHRCKDKHAKAEAIKAFNAEKAECIRVSQQATAKAVLANLPPPLMFLEQDSGMPPMTREEFYAWKMQTTGIYAEIAAERRRQDEVHPETADFPSGMGTPDQARDLASWRMVMGSTGPQSHAHVLMGEVLEVLAESDPALRRVELVQVAALAIRLIELDAADTKD